MVDDVDPEKLEYGKWQHEDQFQFHTLENDDVAIVTCGARLLCF